MGKLRRNVGHEGADPMLIAPGSVDALAYRTGMRAYHQDRDGDMVGAQVISTAMPASTYGTPHLPPRARGDKTHWRSAGHSSGLALPAAPPKNAANKGGGDGPVIPPVHAYKVGAYKVGMLVYYKNARSSTVVEARVLSKHLDDKLEPYYTIQLEDGREKQTDDAHLKAERAGQTHTSFI